MRILVWSFVTFFFEHVSQHTFRLLTDQRAPTKKKILQIQSSAAYLCNFVSYDVSGVPCGGEATAANIKRQPISVCLALLRATEVFLGL